MTPIRLINTVYLIRTNYHVVKRMRKIVFFLLGAVIFFVIGIRKIYAIDVTATAPQTGIGGLDALIQGALPDVVNDAIVELDKFGDQSDLARGFADASTFTSAIASQRSRPDIKTFAVTAGTMVGVQFPELDYSGLLYNPDAISSAFSDLEEQGDIYLGFAWQMWAAHV